MDVFIVQNIVVTSIYFYKILVFVVAHFVQSLLVCAIVAIVLLLVGVVFFLLQSLGVRGLVVADVFLK